MFILLNERAPKIGGPRRLPSLPNGPTRSDWIRLSTWDRLEWARVESSGLWIRVDNGLDCMQECTSGLKLTVDLFVCWSNLESWKVDLSGPVDFCGPKTSVDLETEWTVDKSGL